MDIPGPSRAENAGGFVMSLDLELHWGVRDHCSVEEYEPNLRGVRQAVPRLLELFDRHGLGCTWAAVGLLFFDDRDAMMAALPEERPSYRDPRLSPYDDLDIVGPDERRDPYHFGLSLIRRIKAAPRQEIGTHTFSHYYCLEPGQELGAFRADLAAAREAAENEGLRLDSIIFPRNQSDPAYLDVCREAGLIAWRGNERSWLYRAQAASEERLIKRAGRLADAYLPLTGANTARPVHEHGLVNVPSSRFLRPWSRSMSAIESFRLKRILGAMRVAARKGEIFHLWFHPHNFGVNLDENMAFMAQIAAEANRLDEIHGWPSLTMAEVANGGSA